MPRLIALGRGAFATLTLFLCGGCNGKEARDLALKSMDVTTRAEQPVPDAFREWKDVPGRVVRITLTAGSSLRDVAKKGALHVSFNAWFCAQSEHELLFLPFVYDSQGVLGENIEKSTSDNHDIWIYLAATSEPRSGIQSGKNIPRYDLGESADDVCVVVRGRNMALEGFTSNLVRIPAQRLATALK